MKPHIMYAKQSLQNVDGPDDLPDPVRRKMNTNLHYWNLYKKKTSGLTKQQQKQSSHFEEDVNEEILNKLPFLQMSLVEPVEHVTETRDHSLYRSFVMRDAYRCVLQFSGPNNLKCNFSPVSFLLLPEAR